MFIYILRLKRGEKAVFAQHCSESDYTDFRNNSDHEHDLKLEFLATCVEGSKHYDWAKSRRKTIEITSGVGLVKGSFYEVHYTVSEKKFPFKVRGNSSMVIVLENNVDDAEVSKFFRRKIRKKIKRDFGVEALLLAFQITSIDVKVSIF